MDAFEFHIKVPIHPRAKFGLKAMLFAILLLAVGFGAFKLGKERGGSEGYAKGYDNGWAESQNAKLVKRHYRVSDLVLADGPESIADFGKLIQSIQQSVEQNSWDTNGGPAEIAPYPQNLSLVVNQTQRGHNAIEKYLDERRATLRLQAP
ncbi:hypothetical protein TBK1r_08240 [Stieleria magnilauensis]|uniref:Uncharacterized protein n=2 Tax=Stieleria magnilauensis TaxID=2527963 RepID=A0ABX5XMR0_9BACT|nr:hypothetical protein TBK1r_08240 [Planctomycetes bacterium TBK1r]